MQEKSCEVKSSQDAILGIDSCHEVDLLGGGKQFRLVVLVRIADSNSGRCQGTDDRSQKVRTRASCIQGVRWPRVRDIPRSRPVLALDGQISDLVDDTRVNGSVVDGLQKVVGSPPDVFQGFRSGSGGFEAIREAA